jgi:molecular chaperone GrpE
MQDEQHFGAATEDGAASDLDENGEVASGDAQRLETELADMKDRYLRAMAEMDNVRRRARMEAETERKFANERLISEILPVLDDFTRALEAAEQTRDFDALREGVDLTRRKLTDVLERSGLERIEAVGQPFDPNLHEAILQVEARDGEEPHQVVEELRPGYKLHDRVIRPSMVKVASG